MAQIMGLLQPYLKPAAPSTTEPRRPSESANGRYWFAICALTLIVASDYKFRVRDPTQAFSGSIDTFVLLELALYGCVGLYLLRMHGHPPRIRRTQPHLYLACFYVGLMVLSLAYTAYPQYAMVRVGEMAVLLGLTLVGARIATRADLHRFAHLFIALVAASVVYGVLFPSSPVTKLQTGRFTWLAIHPIISGALAGLATVLAAGYLLAGRRPRPGPVWPRVGYWIALLLVGGGLLGSQTRGAVAGTLIAIVFLIFALRGGRNAFEMQLALGVAAVGIALAAGGSVIAYFQRGETTQQLASLNSRTDYWRTAVTAIERHPMFGYGVTSSRGLFYDATGLGGSHNAVINALVELGIVGLLVWGTLVVTLVLGVRRLPIRSFEELRVDRALILAVLTVVLVDGVFWDGPASVSNVACTWLFMCIAWLSVARRYAVENSIR